MKQYIKPKTEMISAQPYTLLDSSILEDEQTSDFMGKENNGWDFDEDDDDSDAWSKGFSVWN